MKGLVTQQECALHLSDASIFNACKKQIQKDLLQFSLSLPDDGNLSVGYDYLRQALYPLVQYLMDKQLHKMAQLIYRIDLPENEVARYLDIQFEGDACGEICRLIIGRELQKVLIRRAFSE